MEETTKIVESVEGFTNNLSLSNMRLHNKPFLFNGVCIKRYKITIEEIIEPKNVLIDRLTNLWETECYNQHYSKEFSTLAEELGIELDSSTRAIRAKKC